MNIDSKAVFAVMNQAIASGYTFLLLVVASRVLEVNDFAKYSLIILVINAITIAPQAFAFMPLLSNSTSPKKLDSRIGSDFIFMLLTIIIQLTLVSFILILFGILDEIGANIFLIILLIFLFQSYEFLKRIIFVRNDHKFLLLIETIKLTSTFVFIKICFDYSVTYSIDQIILGMLIGYASFIIAMKKDMLTIFSNIKIKKHYFQFNFNFGKWVFVGNLISYLQNNFFVYVSAIVLSLEIVAGLNAIRSLVGVSTVIFLSIDNFLAPKLAIILEKNGYIYMLKIIKKIYFKISIVIAIIYSISSIFHYELITIIFGSNFSEYSYFLPYFLFGSFFAFLSRPVLILSRTVGLTEVLFYGSLIPAIIVVLFSYFLITTFGVHGSLLVTIFSNITMAASLIIFYIILSKKIKNKHNAKI